MTKRLTRELTLAQLRQQRACSFGLKKFERIFGGSAVVDEVDWPQRCAQGGANLGDAHWLAYAFLHDREIALWISAFHEGREVARSFLAHESFATVDRRKDAAAFAAFAALYVRQGAAS